MEQNSNSEAVNIIVKLNYHDIITSRAIAKKHFVSLFKFTLVYWLIIIIHITSIIIGLLGVISQSKILITIYVTYWSVYIISLFLNRIQEDMVAQKQWERNTAWHYPIHYSFSNTGVSIESKMSKSDSSWKSFKNVKETKDYFILLYLNFDVLICPKRCFEDDSKITELRNLVEKV